MVALDGAWILAFRACVFNKKSEYFKQKARAMGFLFGIGC
jgi:hypothetical protein